MQTSSESSSTVQWVCGPITATCRPSTGPGGRTTGAGWRWWPVSSPRTDLPPGEAGRAAETARGERSGGSGRGQPGVVVVHGTAVGEQRAVVVEEDDAVAQQAPALLGVAADRGGEVARVTGGLGTGGYVVAHRHHFRIEPGSGPAVTCGASLITDSTSLRPF